MPEHRQTSSPEMKGLLAVPRRPYRPDLRVQKVLSTTFQLSRTQEGDLQASSLPIPQAVSAPRPTSQAEE